MNEHEQERDPFPEVDPDRAAESEAEGQTAELIDTAAEARRQIAAAVLRLMTSELDEEQHGHSADEQQYAEELVALAARELVRATDALPEGQKPVGWTDTPPGYAGVLETKTGLAAEVERLKRALAGHLFDGESLSTREAIRSELIEQGLLECDKARAEVFAVREQLKVFLAGVQEAHTALAQAAYGPSPSDPAEALRKAIRDLAGPLSRVVVERTP